MPTHLNIKVGEKIISFNRMFLFILIKQQEPAFHELFKKLKGRAKTSAKIKYKTKSFLFGLVD